MTYFSDRCPLHTATILLLICIKRRNLYLLASLSLILPLNRPESPHNCEDWLKSIKQVKQNLKAKGSFIIPESTPIPAATLLPETLSAHNPEFSALSTHLPPYDVHLPSLLLDNFCESDVQQFVPSCR